MRECITENKITLNGSRTSSRKPTLYTLQSLRAAAFLGIFLSHALPAQFTAFGAWGVCIFIILSGFLMVYQHLEKSIALSPLRFALKKISKLYILYVFMLLAFALPKLFSILSNTSLNNLFTFFMQFAADALLLQAWIPNSAYYFSLNGVAWYLSTAAFLYAVFPLLLKIIRRYKSTKHAICGIIAALLYQTALSVISAHWAAPLATAWFSQHWGTYIFPLYRIGDYFIGCNIGYIFLRNDKCVSPWRSTAFEAATIVLTAVSLVLFSKGNGIFHSESVKYTLLFVPACTLTVYLTARDCGFLTKLTHWQVAIWLGNLSSFTYLIHLFVIEYVQVFNYHFFSNHIGALWIAIISLCITVVCAKLYQIIYSRIILKIKLKHEVTV